MDVIKAKKNPIAFNKFAIEESRGQKPNLILSHGFNKIKSTKILNEAHSYKNYLNYRGIENYIHDPLNWYKLSIYSDC